MVHVPLSWRESARIGIPDRVEHAQPCRAPPTAGALLFSSAFPSHPEAFPWQPFFPFQLLSADRRRSVRRRPAARRFAQRRSGTHRRRLCLLQSAQFGLKQKGWLDETLAKRASPSTGCSRSGRTRPTASWPPAPCSSVRRPAARPFSGARERNADQDGLSVLAPGVTALVVGKDSPWRSSPI